MNHTNSIYVVAGILFIIGIPLIFIGGLVSVYQEVKRVREKRRSGEQVSWYKQPKLLAGLAGVLFALTVSLAGGMFVGISYKFLPNTLTFNGTMIGLALLAGLFAIVYLIQSVRQM